MREDRTLRIPNINFVILSGRLVSDAEIRNTSDGRNFIKFRLASDNPYRSGGEWKSNTVFIDVLYSVGRNDLNEQLVRRLTKGTPVVVEGKLRYREWESEGKKFNTYEIRAYRVQILERAATREESVDLSEYEPPSDEDIGLPPGDMPF
ncbi:MAG: single-stranded DNA-binding protein [Thermotogae bacterium]|nr:single-stranded DNA-binding protein [Thermotogota bacterium]